MRRSVVKILALFSVVYMLFAAAVLVAAVIQTWSGGLSPAGVARQLLTWEPRWWWLSLIGGALHLLGFLRSLRRPRLMVGNTLCLWAFIAYALVPNYTLIILAVHALGVGLIMGYRWAPGPTTEGESR
ncbi:hypothetical protein [Lacticaseibacillus parakribbianus]|uniref:hypothetical protein n=1 Tax=Lacticaseibacillus parakribbianus TaxID=2970927 RepID=UPI0021CB540C|nr:hypothetical protein [Lacticaseibacillus parakribbianus]